jgi:DNA-binding MarR family transcriptional regulator
MSIVSNDRRIPAAGDTLYRLEGPAMTSHRGLEALYRRPAFLIRRVHQVAIALFDEECAPFGVTNTQHGLLQAIQASPGMDVIGAARAVGVDRTTANVAVTNLERRGWIERTINPDDRRSHKIKISTDGTRLLRDTKSALERAQRRLLGELSVAEVRAFVTIMEKIAAPLPLGTALPKAPRKSTPVRNPRV